MRRDEMLPNRIISASCKSPYESRQPARIRIVYDWPRIHAVRNLVAEL
jgi:hypothetical protein